jgi:hypothetical protein
MNLKIVLLALCGLGLAVGLGGLYMSNSKLSTEVEQLRAENAQLQEANKAAEQTNSVQLQRANEELARLRKDNEELLKLRNEVRQLRGEKVDLAKQVQTAQMQAQTAQTQAQNAQAQNAQAQAQAEALRRAAAQNPSGIAPEVIQARVCQNNVRLIEAAKLQWAATYNRPVNTPVSAAELASYLPNNTLPACPAGGAYNLNAVGVPAVCSLPAHALPK